MKEILFAVLDTNVWIAGINFANSKSRKILQAGGITFLQSDQLISFESGINVELFFLTSTEIVMELIDTLRKYFNFTEDEAYLWWRLICENTVSVRIVSIINLCRDSKDNKFLECAVDGEADYLISNDEDLLIIKKINNIPIIKIGNFFRVLFEK